MYLKQLILILLLSAGLAAYVAADPDAGAWPQWGGPARDFTATAAELAATWREEGPRQLWRRELGDDGYSGIVAAGGRLYTMARRGDDEVVMALDAATGESVWEFAEAVATQRTTETAEDFAATDPDPSPLSRPRRLRGGRWRLAAVGRSGTRLHRCGAGACRLG